MTDKDYALAVAEAVRCECETIAAEHWEPFPYLRGEGELDRIIESVPAPVMQHHAAPTRVGWWWARRKGKWEAVRVTGWGAASEDRHVAMVARAGSFTGAVCDAWVGPLLPPDTTTPAPDVQGADKLAGNSDVQAQGYDSVTLYGCAGCKDVQAQIDAAVKELRGDLEIAQLRLEAAQKSADAAVATAQEQLDAREKSSRNLAHYASHDEGSDAPMSANDLVTRDALRVIRQAMEIALAERAKAQQALIYLAREAGGSPVATIELDRHGQEIRAALVKLHEHAERIARLTGFVSMRLGAEYAGDDCVDTAIRFMESALDEEAAAGAKAAMKDRAFTDAEWATRYGAMCRERDRALTERAALCEKHRADENWHDLKDCLACAVEELEGRILTLDADLDAAVEERVTRLREIVASMYHDSESPHECRVCWLEKELGLKAT